MLWLAYGRILIAISQNFTIISKVYTVVQTARWKEGRVSEVMREATFLFTIIREKSKLFLNVSITATISMFLNH